MPIDSDVDRILEDSDPNGCPGCHHRWRSHGRMPRGVGYCVAKIKDAKGKEKQCRCKRVPPEPLPDAVSSDG